MAEREFYVAYSLLLHISILVSPNIYFYVLGTRLN